MRKINKQDPLDEFEDFRLKNKGANWSDLPAEIRINTRSQLLLEEQNCQCGYTELLLNDDGDCHIDHYYKKGIDSSVTFNWNNLIAASIDEDFGAKYKDNKYSIKADEYIKIYNPVIENPENYFYYLQNGEIEPKEGLEDSEKDKVKKTVEVFNLNADNLSKRRRDLIYQIGETKKGGLDKDTLQLAFSDRSFRSVQIQEIS